MHLSACVVAIFAATAVAVMDESSLKVVAPTALTDEYTNGIHHSEALFGIPQYGRFVTAKAFQVMDGDNASNGCATFPNKDEWGDKPILMLQRGGCHFTDKVANAQLAGAAAALVVNDAPVCGYDPVCDQAVCATCVNGIVTGDNPNGCECILPLMNDDGVHTITIPSFLIPQSAGAAISGCAAGQAPCAADDSVVLRMEWSLPAPDDRVEWSIWSTASDPAAESFREQFVSLVPKLGSTVLFTPEYFIYDGTAWGCTNGAPGRLPCDSQCINDGKYCSPDPDHKLDEGISGADVVLENLRQICVFKVANETVLSDNAIRYWRYTQLFSANCQGDSWTKDCSHAQVDAAGLSWADVTACVTASGDASYPNGGVNSLLEASMRDRAALFIVNLPTIVINNVIERGSITPASVLQTMCSGFQAARPDVCQCSNVDSAWLTVCVTKGLSEVPPEFGGTKGLNPESSGMPGWATFVIVLLVLVVIGLAVGGFIAYRRTHSNIRSMLEDYRRLEGDDDNTQLTQL